jgi:hypothetical protein
MIKAKDVIAKYRRKPQPPKLVRFFTLFADNAQNGTFQFKGIFLSRVEAEAWMKIHNVTWGDSWEGVPEYRVIELVEVQRGRSKRPRSHLPR